MLWDQAVVIIVFARINTLCVLVNVIIAVVLFNIGIKEKWKSILWEENKTNQIKNWFIRFDLLSSGSNRCQFCIINLRFVSKTIFGAINFLGNMTCAFVMRPNIGRHHVSNSHTRHIGGSFDLLNMGKYRANQPNNQLFTYALLSIACFLCVCLIGPHRNSARFCSAQLWFAPTHAHSTHVLRLPSKKWTTKNKGKMKRICFTRSLSALSICVCSLLSNSVRRWKAKRQRFPLRMEWTCVARVDGRWEIMSWRHALEWCVYVCNILHSAHMLRTHSRLGIVSIGWNVSEWPFSRLQWFFLSTSFQHLIDKKHFSISFRETLSKPQLLVNR